MRRREVIVGILTTVASAGCMTTEAENMADELNLTNIKTTEVNDSAYMNETGVVRATDKEAGLVYILTRTGSQGTAVQVVPLGQTNL